MGTLMRFLLALLLALISVDRLTAPAHAQVWIWSQNATNNGNIDPLINWQEGMPPSAVNDSSRAEMGVISKWRDDSNGLVTLGGTSTAYTAATNQGNQSGGVSSLTPGYRLCFAPNVVNGASPTLAVDGQAAKPLRLAPATNLGGSEMRIGTPYCATYFSSNGGEYILNEFYATIIAGGSITYGQIQNVGASRLLGNPTGSPASVSEISLGAGLGFSGTSVLVPNGGIGTAQIANNAVGSTQLANGAVGTSQIAGSAVTYAKIQNETNATILGNDTGGAAAPSELTLGQGLGFSGSTVQVPNLAITSGLIANSAVGTTQLANSAVTYAKIQNESNATLLGNDSGGAAAPSEITLGTGLQFSSSTVLATNYFAPNIQVFTSGSSLTYTTPTNGGNLPLYLRVKMVAGGGGGGTGSSNAGGAGGDTSFGTWTAIHGAGGLGGTGGGSGAGGTGGVNGTGTVVRRLTGQNGGAGSAGGIGGNSTLGGAGQITQAPGAGLAAVTNSGSGGSGGSGGPGGAGGGGGEYAEFIITSPAASYTYTVGAAGAAGSGSGNPGGAGAAGRIEVEAFWQ